MSLYGSVHARSSESAYAEHLDQIINTVDGLRDRGDVINMAHRMNLKIVAEGVETAEQRDRL